MIATRLATLLGLGVGNPTGELEKGRALSLAKINRIGKVRKPGTCEKCGDEIKVGDSAVKFAVGFRGRTRVRCTKSACFPKPSERESSLVSSVYAAQEEVDLSTTDSLDDLHQTRDDVATATREVAGEYEDSEMFEKNYDLQERADMLNSAADELEEWEPAGEEPNADEGEWTVDGTDYDNYEEARTAWLEAARTSLQDAIDQMELP